MLKMYIGNYATMKSAVPNMGDLQGYALKALTTSGNTPCISSTSSSQSQASVCQLSFRSHQWMIYEPFGCLLLIIYLAI